MRLTLISLIYISPFSLNIIIIIIIILIIIIIIIIIVVVVVVVEGDDDPGAKSTDLSLVSQL